MSELHTLLGIWNSSFSIEVVSELQRQLGTWDSSFPTEVMSELQRQFGIWDSSFPTEVVSVLQSQLGIWDSSLRTDVVSELRGRSLHLGAAIFKLKSCQSYLGGLTFWTRRLTFSIVVSQLQWCLNNAAV